MCVSVGGAMQQLGTRAEWEQWLPFLATFRAYRRENIRPDLFASLTVTLLVVPQAIAYAMIAGLPPLYGLYASIVVTILAGLFCQSELVICGPTNAISLMVASTWMVTTDPSVCENPMLAVTLLTLMVGVLQIVFGLLKVGNLAQFVSRSVLVGFITGAGLLIALNQLPNLFGLALPKARHFLGQNWNLITHLPQLNLYTLGVGLFTILVIVAGERWNRRAPWALIAVVAAAAMTYTFDLESYDVEVIGAVPSGLPPFALPTVRLTLVADLADNALAIAILGAIETLSIAKNLSLTTGQRSNNNQDFLGMGVAHLGGAFFSCMPGCGSLTRSALNYHSGARTRLAAILCGVWVAVILLLLGPFARYIPKAALAGMVILLGLRLIKWEEIRAALLTTRSDAAVLLITFGCTLVLHLDTAIYFGVVSSLVLFLRKASAPHLVEYNLEGDNFREIQAGGQRAVPEISIIHVEGELFFGAAELFEDEVRRLTRDPNIRVVILRLKNARHLDATAVMALDQLWQFLTANQRLLLISGATPEVMRVLRRGGLLAKMGDENVFPAEDNLTAATRKALLRAQRFLDGAKPEVRVFYEKTHAEQQGMKSAP